MWGNSEDRGVHLRGNNRKFKKGRNRKRAKEQGERSGSGRSQIDREKYSIRSKKSLTGVHIREKSRGKIRITGSYTDRRRIGNSQRGEAEKVSAVGLGNVGWGKKKPASI